MPVGVSQDRVVVHRTMLESSRLGFGTASLHHLVTRAARQRLLSTAYDCGLTHFDTARMYGDGIAERELGIWLRGQRRESVTVATKAGIPADGLADWFPPLGYVRRVSRRFAFSRRREATWRRLYSPEAMRRSLERSLKLLGVDYLDLFFIHDPRQQDLGAVENLGELLVSLKQAGKIRYAGVAGDARTCLEAEQRLAGVLDVLQVEDSIDSREADALATAGWPLQVTFGYLRRAIQADKMKGDFAVELMRQALQRNREGVVLVSSRSPTRLIRLAKAAGQA